MEFDLYGLCGSVHFSALIKEIRQRVSVLSHRLLGVHSSETLITPALDSGKPLSHVLQTALPLHGAHERLENQHVSARVWGGPAVFCWCVALTASGEEQVGGQITRADKETASNMPFTLFRDTGGILDENEIHI